jgi:hypothetical protein
MELKLSNLILAISLASFSFGGCKAPSDEEAQKQCDDNKLTTVFDRYINVNYEFARGINIPTAGHDALDALTLTITGSVRKMNCLDDESSFDKINCTFYPSLVANGKSSYKFLLSPGKPAENFFIHFYNKLEYVSVKIYMKVVFSDGKIYQSSETYSNTNRIKYWSEGDIATYTINMN